MTAIVKRHKILFILLAVIIIAVLTGSILFIKLRPSGEEKNAGQKNNIITLNRQTLTKSISATGTVKSANSKTVSAKSGNLTVKNLTVQVGDAVKKGDTLVTFDKSDLESTLADAKDNLSTVKADSSRSISSATQQLTNARETYSSENSKLSKAVKKAKKTLADAKKKVKSLKKQIKAATNATKKRELQEQLTKAQEEVSQAQDNYENTVSNQDSSARQNKSNIQNAENAVDNANSSAQKNIKEAEKQVKTAEENLKNCTVTAPISGIVTAVNVEEGDTYTGGDLLQIDDTSSFTVTTTVDEYDISDVSVGQRAVILTEATDKEEIEGVISFVAPSTNATSSSTSGSDGNSAVSVMSTSSSDGYEVIIDITDKNDKLKMGLTAKCSLIIEEAENVFAVPYDAVHQKDNDSSVIYVAEDKENTDKYKEISVTKGMESDYYVEINGNDLKEGMLVVIPTDETEEESSDDDSEQKGFGFNGAQGRPDGNMERSNRDFKNGSGGGNAPAAPGN